LHAYGEFLILFANVSYILYFTSEIDLRHKNKLIVLQTLFSHTACTVLTVNKMCICYKIAIPNPI
jgi:hypothetical protein